LPSPFFFWPLALGALVLGEGHWNLSGSQGDRLGGERGIGWREISVKKRTNIDIC